MGTRHKRALGAFGLLAGLLLAGRAPAADPPSDKAKERHRVREALQLEVIEWDAPSPPKQVGPGAWSLSLRPGIFLERNNGRARLQFGGRVLLDGAVFHLDDGLRGQAGPAGWDRDAEVRQGQVFAQGAFLGRFFAKVVYDWEEEELLDVFFGMRGLGPFGTLQAGYMKTPSSLEARTSRLALTFMERSLANALAPKRDSGVLLTDTLLSDRLRWAAGAFVATDEFGSIDDEDHTDGLDRSWSTNLRITGLPVWVDEGKRMALLGFSYAHRFDIDDELGLSVRPESRLVPFLLATGPIAGGRSGDIAGLEAAWVDGPLSAQAELTATWLQRRGAPDLFFWGGYVQASWFLTGERRIYGRRSGSFVRVVPHHAFAPWKGRWGAFQLAARLSWLDLDDADISGGRQLDLTLGVNWYLHANARLMMNYVHAHVRGAGNANIAQLRIQADY